MKTKVAVLLVVMLGLITPVFAGSEDMTYQCWDEGCEHTMTTNHFELAPGEIAEVPIDISSCVETPEGMLFFGYHTTKNSSRQLTPKNKVQITVLDGANEKLWTSDTGSLYIAFNQAIAASNPTSCTMQVQNMNQNKSIKIRLRSQAIW